MPATAIHRPGRPCPGRCASSAVRTTLPNESGSFGGSGTTMLAAERTGRICYSVEIAPQYVDVAIKRFQQNHPGVPVTLIATGQSFDEIATEREMEVAA